MILPDRHPVTRTVASNRPLTAGILWNAGVAGYDTVAAVHSAAFWFEPNDLAAMPSVHVAMAVLVFLVLGRIMPWGWVIGALYALAMSISVIYLGDHFALDVAAGWLVALAAWRLSRVRSAPDHAASSGPS